MGPQAAPCTCSVVSVRVQLEKQNQWEQYSKRFLARNWRICSCGGWLGKSEIQEQASAWSTGETPSSVKPELCLYALPAD